MKQINLKIDDELLKKIDAHAEKAYSGNRSSLVRDALDAFIDESQKQYEGIPPEIKERIAFMMLLVLNGKQDEDWEILQSEVMELWKNVQ